MNNAQTSAQARAFRARQIAHQKRAAEERKLRAALAGARAEAAAPSPPAAVACAPSSDASDASDEAPEE